ncbi:MAG: hypothetical protein NC489_39295 [Ruminococcus flavefaciens]|nr:hypothetical protein [Ruminococcus flavefaciens]
MKLSEHYEHLISWPLENADTGIQNAIPINWAKSVSAQNSFILPALKEIFAEAMNNYKFVSLHIIPEIPSHLNSFSEITAAYINFLVKLGKFCKPYSVLFSIDITFPDALSSEYIAEILEFYLYSFPTAYLLLDPFHETSIRLVQRGGHLISGRFGLIFDMNVHSLLELTETLSALALTDLWKHSPIRMLCLQPDIFLIKEARRLHVSILDTHAVIESEQIASLGARIQIRYLCCPCIVHDCLHVRTWIVNVGNCPCYQDATFFLKMVSTDGEELTWDTGYSVKNCIPGLDVFPEFTFPISTLPDGEYSLQIALINHYTHFPVTLGIDGRISDGYFITFLKVEKRR